MDSRSSPEVPFNAVIAASEKSLTVEYRLNNAGAQPIYVFDRTTRFDNGQVRVEPERMFVLLAGNDEVRVLHAFIGPPRLHDVRRRPPLYVSVVEPHAEHRRKVVLPLPLLENQQFYSADPDSAPPVIVHRVTVQVGWVEQRDEMNPVKDTLSGAEETKLTGSWNRPLQRIAQASASVAGVAVLRHREPFERDPDLGE